MFWRKNRAVPRHSRPAPIAPPGSGRLLLLIALALVLLPQLSRMPALLVAGCVAVLVWRVLYEWKGWALPARWLRTLIVVAGVAAVLQAHRSLLGLDQGMALLAVMLSFKLLELRSLRDAMIALFMGYFMVVGNFLFDQSMLMGAYLFLVVLLLTSAMAALNHPGGSLADLRSYFKLGGGLLLQALPMMLLLFVLFPRIDQPLWAVPEPDRQGRTGLSDRLEMGTISELADSNEVAFRVDFDGLMPPANQLYWRGPILWRTDGRNWHGMYQQPTPQVPMFERQDVGLSYHISQEPSSRSWLFALDLPTALPEGLEAPSVIRPDFQLLYARDVNKRIRYSLHSSLDYRLEPDDLPYWEEALQLPAQANPRSRELAEGWRAQGLDDAAIIEAALTMFREQPFYYSRQPPLLDEDPVDDFLYRSRRGFCEHYAAAFVTLMRAAGVPSRLVTGYQGGERNPVADYLIVRQSDAHAWAEVWLQGEGWVRVDPTSVIPPERIEDMLDSGRFDSVESDRRLVDSRLFGRLGWHLRSNWDALNHRWDRWVQGFNSSRQQQLLEQLGLADWGWRQLVMLMTGLLFAAMAPVAWWLLRRPRPSDPVQAEYERFCRRLAAIGLLRRDDEGPQDFAARVTEARPDLQPQVEAISTLYGKLRYGRAPLRHGLPRLRQAVRGFRPR